MAVKKKEEAKKKTPDKAKNEVNFDPVTDQESVLEYVMEYDLSDVDDYKEIIDDLMEDLSVTQRLKKKQVMKRYRTKIKLGRKRAMKRRANNKTINKRSRRQAISGVKKFITKGRDMKKMSASEKNRIERLVKKRKNLVDRSARKNRIKTKQRERKRFQKADLDFNANQLVEKFNEFYDILNK